MGWREREERERESESYSLIPYGRWKLLWRRWSRRRSIARGAVGSPRPLLGSQRSVRLLSPEGEPSLTEGARERRRNNPVDRIERASVCARSREGRESVDCSAQRGRAARRLAGCRDAHTQRALALERAACQTGYQRDSPRWLVG